LAYGKERYKKPEVKARMRLARKEWGERNKGKEAKRLNTRYVENRRVLWQLKADKGCIHCGERDPRCLQFHHQDPEQKECNVSRLVCSLSRALEEAARCVVMCANCHCKLHVPDLE
jgi:hypothetical protein